MAAAGDPGVLDFDTDDDDEPRTIVIRGFGPLGGPARPCPRAPATPEGT